MVPFNNSPGPLESASNTFQLELSYFPKDLLFIENVGNEHPESGGNYVLSEVFSVRLVVPQLPLEGEVALEHLMANIHQERIHSWVKEWGPCPQTLHIHSGVQDEQDEEGKGAQGGDVGNGPEIFVYWNRAFIFGNFGQSNRNKP